MGHRIRICDDSFTDGIPKLKNDVMKSIGIDVSKLGFMVSIPVQDDYRVQSFNNDVKGIKKFIILPQGTEAYCVSEAQGNYSTLLVHMLQEEQILVSMFKPTQISHFAKMMLGITS